MNMEVAISVKMKLKMKIRRRKLMKRVVDVMKAGLRKANHSKRYRYGKGVLSKEKNKIQKIEREFYGNGLDVLESFQEFMKEGYKRIV